MYCGPECKVNIQNRSLSFIFQSTFQKLMCYLKNKKKYPACKHRQFHCMTSKEKYNLRIHAIKVNSCPYHGSGVRGSWKQFQLQPMATRAMMILIQTEQQKLFPIDPSTRVISRSSPLIRIESFFKLSTKQGRIHASQSHTTL